MPSYEYYCRKCDQSFEVRMSISEHESKSKQVECPHCHGTEVEQVPARFTAMTSKKS